MALYERFAQQQRLVRVRVDRNANIASYYGILLQHQRTMRNWSAYFILNFLLFLWALLKAAGL